MSAVARLYARPVHDPGLVRRLLDLLPLFAEVRGRERDALAAVFSLRVLEDREPLCREGDDGGSFYVVAKGIVGVYAELPGGRLERLSEVGPNGTLGHVALLDGRPRNTTCIPRGRCVVLECRREHFDRLFEAHSTFAFELVERAVVDLAKRLREANRQLADLYASPARTGSTLRRAALDIRSTLTG